jgi:predicted nucleic acid-binding Zn ribbon protein
MKHKKNSYLRRTPKDYDGQQVTTRHLRELLPTVLSKIGGVFQERGDLVLAAWPEMIGPQLASMTQAVSFNEGVLLVHVKNSTLYSLLSQNEKPRILKNLRERFPNTTIKNILFRLG